MRKTSNISNIQNGGKFSLLKRAFTCRRLNEIPHACMQLALKNGNLKSKFPELAVLFI